MNALLVVLLTPLLGALVLRLLPSPTLAGWFNLGVSVISLGAALWLGAAVAVSGEVAGPLAERIFGASAGLGFRVDAFNVYLVVLTAFVGVTTSIFSRPYMRHVLETGRIGPRRLRTYHSMYQLFMFTMLLALTTDNLGVMWVAVEGATLATVLLVSLYRTPEAVEAAWKYFILCGVGIALALFGTVLTYFAAQRVIADPAAGLTWSTLYAQAGEPGAGRDAARLRLPAGGLWDQGGSGPDAPMAAGRPLRGPHADVGGALGAPAQRRPLCRGAAQDAGRRVTRGDRLAAPGGQPADGLRAGVLPGRRALPAPPARHQAHVQLLVHRAHGAHDLCLWAGRAARHLRRPAAHAGALAHQVGDLRHRRSRRPYRRAPSRSNTSAA